MTAAGVTQVARTLGRFLLNSTAVAEHCDAPGEVEDWVPAEEVTAILKRHGAYELIEAALDDIILLVSERKEAAA
jgi:hypothetical protein